MQLSASNIHPKQANLSCHLKKKKKPMKLESDLKDEETTRKAQCKKTDWIKS